MPRLAFNRKDMASKRQETMRLIVRQVSPDGRRFSPLT
jgi:hypothetical protein